MHEEIKKGTGMFDLIKHIYENNYGDVLTAVLLVSTFLLMAPLLGTPWGTPLPIVLPAAALLYAKMVNVYARARVENLNPRNWKVTND